MKHDNPSSLPRRPPRRALIPLFLFVVCLLGNTPAPSTVVGNPSQGVEVTCPAYDASTLPAALPPSPTVGAGTIPGSFSVSPGGQATYALPLTVPPGRLGMEPKLAIAYDSSAGEGPLGVGFGLQGLSAITRCPANMAQDGEIRAVRYDAGDHFCLDGVRVVQVPHSTGANGPNTIEARTFPDTMRRLVMHVGDNGPLWWEVDEKDGRIRMYGATPDSQAMAMGGTVAAWHLSSDSDRRGNAVAYTYQNDPYWFDGHTQEILLAEIAYTSQGTTPASRRVTFTYAPTTPSTLFAAGLSIIKSHVLTKIDMLTEPGSSLVRSYQLDIEPATTTRRNTLRSVTECAGDGACKPPTRFAWSDNPLGFTQTVTPVMVPPSQQGVQLDQSFGKWTLADVNGDGLDDLVVVLEDADDPTFDDWNVALNTGGAFGVPTRWAKLKHPATMTGDSWDGRVNEENWSLTPMDYDQDGLTDILLDTPNPDASSWPHYRWLKAMPDHSFALRDTAIVQPPGISFNMTDPDPLKPWSNRFARIGDINGDGIGDLIQCVNPTWNNEGYNPSLGSPIWTVNLWVPDVPGVGGPGFDANPIAIPGTGAVDCAAGVAHVHVVDVDGDGASELLMPMSNGQYGAVRQQDGQWVEIDTTLPIQSWIPGGSSRVVHWLDANGDGLPDAFLTGLGTACDPPATDCENPSPYTLDGWPFDVPFQAIDNGKLLGTPTGTLVHDLGGPRMTDWWGDQGIALDYDGDGRTDFMLPVAGQCPDHSDHACWVVLRSNPTVNGFNAAKNDPLSLGVATPIPTPIGEIIDDETDVVHTWFNPIVTDVNGDGRHDLVAPSIVGDGTFTVYRNGGPQDLLLSVTDGMSALDPGDPGFVPAVSITYGSLVDRSITSGESAEAAEGETYLRHSDPGNGCAYPRSCVAGAGRVVASYEINDGENQPRHFSVKYRDGRYHRRGRGMLGFGERIVLDEDAGSGRADFYDNVTWDDALSVNPFAGQVVEAWAWSPASATQAKPTQIELSYGTTTLHEVPTDPSTYFTLPVTIDEKREEGTFKAGPGQSLLDYVKATATKPATVLSDTFSVVSSFDTFGNVLAQHAYADGVDLHDSVKRIVDNDTAHWLLGEVTYDETCSLALGENECRTTSRKFDGYGEVTSAVTGDPLDPGTQLTIGYDHDAFGNVTRTTAADAFGHARSMCVSYEPEGIFPYAARNQLGHTTLFAYDGGLGVLTGSVDPNGLTTHLRHDGFGRLTEEQHPDGSFASYSLTRHKNGGPSGDWWNVKAYTEIGGGASSSRELDSLGRPVRALARVAATKSCGASVCASELEIEEDTTYDHIGRVTRVTLPWMVGDVLSGKNADTYDYDDVGRVVAHVEPWGRRTTYAYGNNVVAATDWLGTTRRQVDALGRIVMTTDKDGGTTQTAYGPFSLPYRVTRFGAETTTTVRDAYGRVREEDDPDRGRTFTDYDGFGEVLSVDDAALRHFAFAYDTIGRLVERDDTVGYEVKKQGPLPVSITRWTYDTAGHGIGKLARVTSPAGHTDDYTYTPASQPWWHTLTFGDTGESFAAGLGYDGFGRLQQVAYPHPAGVDALAVDRNFDAFGNVVAVRDHETGAVYWQLGQLDGAGRPTHETLGNGVSVQHDYAPESGVVTHIQADRWPSVKGTAALQDLGYGYDLGLRMTSRDDALQAGAGGPLREGFAYDAIDRLTQAQVGWPVKGQPSGAIAYAPNGNIEAKDGLAYGYDPAHPHAVLTVGAGAFVNDEVGNQTERPGAAVAYTPFDLPDSYALDDGTSTVFAYDGGQHRIRKTRVFADGEAAPLSETIYLDGLYERVRSDGEVHRFYVGAGSATVVLTRATGGSDQAAYLLSDALGSVDVVTDGSGSVVERRSYDAFGARRNTAGWGPWQGALASAVTPVGFTGQEEDDEAGLVNMRGRIYDPRIGRFLSTDPIVSRPGFAQSWNPYSYVLNSPLNFTDPSGFQEQGQQPDACGGECSNVDGKWIGAAVKDLSPPSGNDLSYSYRAVPMGDAARDDTRAGIAPAPSDDGTGGGSSTPPSGQGGGTPDPRLSTGGGGANSGSEVQRQLTAEDGRRIAENWGRVNLEAIQRLVLWGVGGPKAMAFDLVVTPAAQAENAIHPPPPGVSYGVVIPFGGGLASEPALAEAAAALGRGVDTAALEARAVEVHGALGDAIAQKQRTTAVLDVGESRIVGGGVRNLDKAQRAALLPGEIPAALAGEHAEITVLAEARKLGLAPRAIGVSRTICPACTKAIRDSGGTLTSKTTAVWPH